MQRRYVRPGHCLLRRGHAVAPAALGGHDRQRGNAGYDGREERPVMELAHTCSGLGLRPAAGSVATGVSVAKNARSPNKKPKSRGEIADALKMTTAYQTLAPHFPPAPDVLRLLLARHTGQVSASPSYCLQPESTGDGRPEDRAPLYLFPAISSMRRACCN